MQTCNIRMRIQKKSFKNSKLISLYNNVAFTFECFHDQQHSPVVRESIAKYQTSNSQKEQHVFLSSFFLSSFFFRRTSSILCEPLTVIYAQNSSILYGGVHNPITFHNFKVSKAACNHSLKTMASSLGHHFLHLYSCT